MEYSHGLPLSQQVLATQYVMVALQQHDYYDHTQIREPLRNPWMYLLDQ